VSATADHDGDTRPIPDPTVLTTEQLIREITTLNNTLQLQLTAQQVLVDQRLDSVGAHLEHIESQRVEQKQDTKAAVDAALAAAKEAVKEQTSASDRAINKSDDSTSEQLKQMSTTFTTAIAAVGGSIGDAKERITALESLRLGVKENLSGVYALIGLIITVAVLGLGILTFLTR
jgi:DNA repair exonuclease SbcCD ATPase subunit